MPVDAPKGLVPVRKANGQPWNGAVTKFVVSSSDGTDIFIGDIVKLTGTAGVAGDRVFGEGMIKPEHPREEQWSLSGRKRNTLILPGTDP